jgi:hypothetical protein
MSTSPLTALIWVFAVCAALLGIVSAGTAGLAVRHRRRRRNGVYSRVLAEDPSSGILKVLTVGDYLADPSLRGQIQLRPIREVQTSKDRDSEAPRPSSPG